MKKLVCFILIFLLVLIHFFSYAQEKDSNETIFARAHGVKDAENDVKHSQWFMIGCAFNIFGLIYSNIKKPPIKGERFIGKSPEYIEAYTQAYKEKARSIQFFYAKGGCIVSSVVILTSCIFVVGSLTTDYDVETGEGDFSGCAGP